MFFQSWWGLLRVAIAAIIGYAALLVLLRASGKRTLSKLNAFDFVITIALGSTLATIVLSKSTTIAEGVTALGILVGLQFVIAWLQVRSPRIEAIIKSEPSLLLYRGRLQQRTMRRERVTEQEVKAAIRDSGGTSVSNTFAVVLETDGSLVAISSADEATGAMHPVRGPEPDQHRDAA